MKSATWIVAAFFLLLAISLEAQARKKINLVKAVPPARQISMDEISHDAWDNLLKTYVNDKGQVNYRSLKSNRKDQARLNRYLNHLAMASLTKHATKNARLAFWINAYNAVTIKGILREYPTTSIRNHTARLYGYNIWKDLLLNVGGKSVSLESIEHEILRKMGDARIHFAIVCASHSCPRLRNEAYRAETISEQLDSNAKVFFANRENFQFDAQRNRVYLSTILKWFAEDFGENQSEQLRSVARFLPGSARQAIRNKSVRVSYLSYDWKLNDWNPR